MTISVIIPIYNEQKYLERCLASFKRQIVKPDEILVVNNNCTDKSVEIVKKFNYVKVVTEKIQGISYARNKGFNSAKGDIIARCDADTVVNPSWVKKIKENFSNYKIDALTGTAYFYDLPSKNTIYYTSTLDLIKVVLKNHDTLNGFNMAITKKFWKKVKPHLCIGDSEVHEDLDLAIHIIQQGGVIKRDNSLVVGTSARRFRKNPLSGFGEYPVRGIMTVLNHTSIKNRIKKNLS